MGRPKKSAPAPIEPEEESQEIPEDEPEVEGETGKSEPATAHSRSVNQADLVKKAIAAGHEKPASGVPYIKDEFGVDVDPKYYSVAKSQLKKREAKAPVEAAPAKRGPKPKSAAPLVNDYVAPPAKVKSPEGPDMLLALETVKELVGQFGSDRIRRMLDLIG